MRVTSKSLAWYFNRTEDSINCEVQLIKLVCEACASNLTGDRWGYVWERGSVVKIIRIAFHCHAYVTSLCFSNYGPNTLQAIACLDRVEVLCAFVVYVSASWFLFFWRMLQVNPVNFSRTVHGGKQRTNNTRATDLFKVSVHTSEVMRCKLITSCIMEPNWTLVNCNATWWSNDQQESILNISHP